MLKLFWRYCTVILTIAGACVVQAQERIRIEQIHMPELLVLTDGEQFSAGSVDRAMPPTIEPRLGRLAPGAASRFYRSYLIPRVSGYLDRVAPSNLADGLGTIQNVDQQVLHEDVAEMARRRTVRGVSRAIRGYVLEASFLDKLNRRLEVNRNRMREATTAGAVDNRWSLIAGVAHGHPEVGVEFDRGKTELRMTLDTSGSAELQLRHSGFDLFRVVAAYDSREQVYDLSCRLRF